MAMRDPGTPGRNPFFDHGPEAELGDAAGAADDPGSEEPAADPLAGARPPGSDPWPGSAGPDPLGTLAALVDALQGAQPEATEHLVAAAHELVLAVKTVVDATEAVLAATRAGSVTTAGSGTAGEDDAYDPFASDDAPQPRRSGVRRIDLA
jgi:hypothetical protein